MTPQMSIKASWLDTKGHDLSDPKSPNLPFDATNPLDQLGSLDTTLNHPLLSQWPSQPRDLYYSQYTHSRLTGDQDAWNPLLATGVPARSIPHMKMPIQVPDQDCCFSQHQYSKPSEDGSQFIDSYHFTDSGYGRTCLQRNLLLLRTALIPRARRSI